MRHLSHFLDPKAHGLTPYTATFTQRESHAIRSMLDEGVVYRHPVHTETVIVWAKDVADIAAVLTYHYRHSWHDLQLVETDCDATATAAGKGKRSVPHPIR